MVTRFYLYGTEPAPVSVTPDAAWEVTTSALQRRIGAGHKASADAPATTAAFTSNAGQDRLHYQGVSDPLPAGITFDTGVTYKCYVQALESAINDNIVSRLGVRIVSRDGQTVRATPLTVADYSTGTEWNTSLRNKVFANGDAGAGSYTTVDGDRLVVEIGHNDASGASISGQTRYGTGTGVDLGENETDTTTTLVPWFECSNTFNILQLDEKFEVSPDNTTLTVNNTSLTNATNSPVSDSDGARKLDNIGSFSALLNASATTKVLEASFFTDTEFWVRFYFQMDTLPSANLSILELRTIDGGTLLGDARITTAGNLQLRNQASTQIDISAAALAVDVWHRFEFHITATRFECRIFADTAHHSDGTPTEDETSLGGTVSNSGGGMVRFGVMNSTTWQIWVDAFSYRSDTWPGSIYKNLTGSLFTKAPTFNTGAITSVLNLAGSLFQKAPTFATGVVTPGARNLAGTLFTKAPTFSTGAVTSTYPLSGTLFTRAPTFNTGAISQTAGSQPLTGSLFTKAPTFNTGAVTSVRNLSGTLFTKAPTFSTGAITSVRNLAGTLFTRASTFNVGAVTSTRNLAGTLFQKTPTFNTGTVSPGAVNLAGALFSKAPTFNVGAVTSVRNLSGALFSKAPTFNVGAITSTGSLAGTLFQKAPTFFAGTVTPGAVNLAGTLFTKAPTFFAGRMALNLAGTLFQRAPTFATGAVTARRNLAGTTFTKASTFNVGAITAVRNLAGTTFTKAPTFFTGTVTPGPRNLAGVLFQRAPTFFAGRVSRVLSGVLFQNAPAFQVGAITSVRNLSGATFTKVPTFFAGRVAFVIVGTTFETAPTFYGGTVLHQGNLIGEEPLALLVEFFVGKVAHFDYTPEWPQRSNSGGEWRMGSSESWPVSVGPEWPMSPGDE